MSTTYRLVLKSGANAGQIFPLDGPELTIGREPACDIVINDPEVSRRHVRLYLQGQNYVIEDYGSTNGTAVNGQKLRGPYILRPGEMITLGENTHLLFDELFFDPDATQVSARQSVPGQVPQNMRPPVTPMQGYSGVQPEPPMQSMGGMYDPSQAEVNYAGQVPEQPKSAKPRRKIPVFVIILIVLVIVGLCGCLVIFWFIDANNMYCSAIPGITNLVFPNACP